MALKGYILVGLLALILVNSFQVTFTDAVGPVPFSFEASALNRSSFPAGFLFGAASSAFQVEGAASEDGKGPSIWDTFTREHPEKITDGSNGDVTIDQYHRYKEDVGIMKDMNLNSYRFSISWPRILPKGKISGGINYEGIKYYHNLIDELKDHGIEPFVTIFHWDLPQQLEDEYDGFLSSRIVDDFRDFADLCFHEFGRKVKYWTTMNEPYMYSRGGYAFGSFAPGRCSDWLELNCFGGDSGTEPYIVTHNLLLAHAAAVDVYKTNYQARQGGLIGMVLVGNWYMPLSEDDKDDQHAAKRLLDFQMGWYMEPLTTGDYPKNMRTFVGSRLPTFTPEESKLVNGSYDFIGLNYYSASYAYPAPSPNPGKPTYQTDALANVTFWRNGRPLGLRAAAEWLYFYPVGLQDLLLFVKEKYKNPVIFVTENGMNEYNDPKLSIEEALLDIYRIDYQYRHLFYIQSVIEKHGVNVRGYFIWSLLDSHEWDSGFSTRFGLNFVDYSNGLKRYPKFSAQWYKNFLKPAPPPTAAPKND